MEKNVSTKLELSNSFALNIIRLPSAEVGGSELLDQKSKLFLLNCFGNSLKEVYSEQDGEGRREMYRRVKLKSAVVPMASLLLCAVLLQGIQTANSFG